MNGQERHDQISGALGRIEQKIDSHVSSNDRILKRHETAIGDNTADIHRLKNNWSKFKGGTILLAITATVAAIAAKARDIF